MKHYRTALLKKEFPFLDMLFPSKGESPALEILFPDKEEWPAVTPEDVAQINVNPIADTQDLYREPYMKAYSSPGGTHKGYWACWWFAITQRGEEYDVAELEYIIDEDENNWRQEDQEWNQDPLNKITVGDELFRLGLTPTYLVECDLHILDGRQLHNCWNILVMRKDVDWIQHHKAVIAQAAERLTAEIETVFNPVS